MQGVFIGTFLIGLREGLRGYQVPVPAPHRHQWPMGAAQDCSLRTVRMPFV